MRLRTALLLVLTWSTTALAAPADRLEQRLQPRAPRAAGNADLSWIDDPAGYISRWASPAPPADRLERQKALPVRPRPDLLWATSVVGDIIVIESDQYNNYAYTAACPAPNQSQQCTYFNDNALFDIANEVLRNTDDSHDEIVIWSTFAQNGQNYAAYYMPLSNDAAGLGDCNMNSGETQGCVTDNVPGIRVQGLIYMSSVGSWMDQERYMYGQAKPLDDLGAMVYSGTGHETIHRWLAALRFVHPATGQISKQMLGESLAHWHPCVDGEGSMLYGWDWDEQSPGTFELMAESVRYSDLDLYAMGVLPPDSVRSWFIIENGNSSELITLMRDFGYNFNGNISAGPGLFIPIPPVDYIDELLRRYYSSMAPHITATGDRLDLYIDDVLAAEGPRTPSYGRAPTTVRQVWALLTAPGQTIAQVTSQIGTLDQVRQTFERWFVQASHGQMRVCTRLAGDCPAPGLEAQNARFDDSTSSNNGVADPDESVDYWPVAYNAGNDVAHAVAVTGRAIDGQLSLDRTETSIGDIEPGTSRSPDQSLLVYLDGKAECGVPLRFETVFKGDDTPEWRQLQVVYTGLKRIDGSDFENGDDGWLANAAGSDDAFAGQFASGVTFATYAGKARATPAGQTTAGGGWAMLTDPAIGASAGDTDVDGGGTSLQSRPYALAGLKDPHLGYRFWHVAVDNGGTPWEEDANALQVDISGDGGKTFKPLAQHLANTRDWEVAVHRLRDLFKQELPKEIVLRFSQFDGGDDDVVEAGIDDVAIYDLAGKCTPTGCGCGATGAVTPGLALGLGLLLWGWRRRRPTSA